MVYVLYTIKYYVLLVLSVCTLMFPRPIISLLINIAIGNNMFKNEFLYFQPKIHLLEPKIIIIVSLFFKNKFYIFSWWSILYTDKVMCTSLFVKTTRTVFESGMLLFNSLSLCLFVLHLQNSKFVCMVYYWLNLGQPQQACIPQPYLEYLFYNQYIFIRCKFNSFQV